MTTPDKNGEAWGDLPQFRTLRRMVTLLTATLTIGVLTIAATLVIRIASEPGTARITSVPAQAVELPAGETITATGATSAALTFVTRDSTGAERLRLFDPETGAQIGEVSVTRTP